MATETKIKGKLKAQGGLNISGQTANTVPVIDGSNDVVSSAVTSTELGHLSGVTSAIQTQLNGKASSTDLSDHINDASDAHDASAISNIPAGNLAATDVQAALNELQSDIDTRALQSALQAHLDDAVDAHDASAISNIPSGNLAATDIQGAVNELQSDIDTRALDSAVIKKDGSVAFTAAQSMGGFKLTNVADPTVAQDAATKAYVDAIAEGLKPKAAVRAATLVAGTLASSFEDADVIDGVTLATGDRILIKNQAAPAENGIYVVQASGAPVRATDFDSISPIDEINGAYTFVQEGTQAGQGWVQTGTVVTVGTSDINFVFFSSVAGLVGGDGITISGNNVSVDHDGQGLTFATAQLALELDGSTLSKSASGLKLSDTAVTPATLGSASETVTITVDQQGRLTAASEQAISITASQVSDFAEVAQDSVGTILVDSASIDLTYNDATPSITAVVLPAGVDHDALNNFVANEHVDHSTVQIATASATSGLSGGGDITATRNLVVDITGTTALAANVASGDEILIYDVSASALKKATRSELLGGAATSAGDLAEGSFSLANNQAAAANVTGFAFNNAVVRSFSALVSVEIDATADLYESFTIIGIQKNSSWDISIISTGDDSGIVFSITSLGQMQYTSTNNAGFVAGSIKYRAITLTV